jgi:hypothetical protein
MSCCWYDIFFIRAGWELSDFPPYIIKIYIRGHMADLSTGLDFPLASNIRCMDMTGPVKVINSL